MDIRCQGKKHAILDTEDDTLEVKCDSRVCGAGSGVIVLHRFSSITGVLVDTKKYSELRSK